MQTLRDLYRKAAEHCLAEGVELDAEPNGAICQWCQRNVDYRPGTLFFIVTGIACEMADLRAMSLGFANQFELALTCASLVCFGRKLRQIGGAA